MLTSARQLAIKQKVRSFIPRLVNKLNRSLPVWVKIIYFKHVRYVFRISEKQPLILSGRLVCRLRSETHRMQVALTHGEVATNCGLVRLGEEYIGVFKNGTFNFCWEMGLKATVDPGNGIRQKLYIARFNNQLRLQKVTPIAIETVGLAQFDPEQDLIEDARLVHNGKEVIMVTNYVPSGELPGSWPKQVDAWPLIGVLDQSNNAIRLRPVALSGTLRPQKNWIPFGGNGETFLQYSIAPHRILRADPHTGHCEEAWLSHTSFQTVTGKTDFKGGAPLIALGSQMLGACHSWSLNKDDEREYFTYLYLTQAIPPYEITHMSAPLKILMPDRVQYLVGMVLDMSKNSITMSYGVSDCDNYFVEIPLKQVLGLFQKFNKIE
jgi:hypothetical protein